MSARFPLQCEQQETGEKNEVIWLNVCRSSGPSLGLVDKTDAAHQNKEKQMERSGRKEGGGEGGTAKPQSKQSLILLLSFIVRSKEDALLLK